MSTNNVVIISSEPLPQKACKVCGRPVQFTRKASGVWDRIEYCSAACRRLASSARSNVTKGEAVPASRIA